LRAVAVLLISARIAADDRELHRMVARIGIQR